MQSATFKEIDAIRESILRESPFGEVTIREVRAFEGHGEDAYVHLIVYADDPSAGENTWPVDDVFKLRRRVIELAVESEMDLPQIVVDLYPRHDDQHRIQDDGLDSTEP